MDRAPSSAQEAAELPPTPKKQPNSLLRPRSSRAPSSAQEAAELPPPPKKQPSSLLRPRSSQGSSTDDRNNMADPNRQSPLSRAELSGCPHERTRAQPNPHTPDTRAWWLIRWETTACSR
ncbi:hypothetical protein VPH35_111644 [Triticum aestivum]